MVVGVEDRRKNLGHSDVACMADIVGGATAGQRPGCSAAGFRFGVHRQQRQSRPVSSSRREGACVPIGRSRPPPETPVADRRPRRGWCLRAEVRGSGSWRGSGRRRPGPLPPPPHLRTPKAPGGARVDPQPVAAADPQAVIVVGGDVCADELGDRSVVQSGGGEQPQDGVAASEQCFGRSGDRQTARCGR